MGEAENELVKRFWTIYRTHYGPCPIQEKDGKPDEGEAWLWREVILRIGAHRLEEVFAAVTAARGRQRFRPLIEDFKRAYKGITGEYEKPRLFAPCGICDSTGYMVVLAYTKDGVKHLGIGGDDCAIWTVPCLCSRGRRHWPQLDEKEQVSYRAHLERCKDFVVQMREEAKMGESPTSYHYMKWQARDQNWRAFEAAAKAEAEEAARKAAQEVG